MFKRLHLTVLAAVLLAVSVLLLGCPTPNPTPLNQPSGSKAIRPVTNDVVRGFLDKRGVKYVEKDGAFGYKISQDMIVVVQFFPDDQVLYIAIPKIYVLQLEGDQTAQTLFLLAGLMNINNRLLMGKAEWDIDNGQVHFGVAIPTNDGLSYEVFDKYCSYVESKGPEIVKVLNKLAASLKETGTEPGKESKEKIDNSWQ